jgi:hypothetical protein
VRFTTGLSGASPTACAGGGAGAAAGEFVAGNRLGVTPLALGTAAIPGAEAVPAKISPPVGTPGSGMAPSSGLRGVSISVKCWLFAAGMALSALMLAFCPQAAARNRVRRMAAERI